MRHYIYRFRRSLEPIFKHQLIEYTANGYRLNPNINVMTDLQKFDRLYRTETRTGTTSYTDPDTGETVTEEYEYEVQVPYTYYICTVELENFNLSHVPVYIMSHDQLSMYATYMSTLGNRPGLFPDSSYVDAYYNTEYEVYEIPPEALADPQFAAMIEEAEKYLGYPYVWGGSSPSTSFDCSAVLDGGKCILQLRGVRPFMSNKFDITKHPHYKYLSDADSKNNFDIEKYLST